MTFDEVLAKFQGVNRRGANRAMALCPAHPDTKPSLSIRQAEDGTILLHCHSGNGCDAEKIVSAVGLELHDLFPEKGVRESQHAASQSPPKPSRIYPSVKAAVAACARMTEGTHAATWTYHGEDGSECFHVARFAIADGKEFRPIHRSKGGYVIGDPPGLLPLYGLPSLNGAGRVYVVEGEKCADAARSIGLTATTSAHGSKSAHKTDWRLLAGRDVVILPDNDPAGQGYAQ